MLKRLSSMTAGIADLWWSLEDRYPLTLRVTGAVLLMLVAALVLDSFDWLLSVLYVIPIIAGAGGGVLVALLSQFNSEGRDGLEELFWIAVGALAGGLGGWGVSNLIWEVC